MKRAGLIILFIAVGLLLTLGIAELTSLSLYVAAGIGLVACLLLYLMLDIKPVSNSTDATIVRLTKGSWYRKQK